MSENSKIGAKEVVIAFFIGVVFMGVALFGQAIVQEIPSLLYYATHSFSLKSLETGFAELERDNFILFSIYFGIVAGVMQELAKYVAVDMRSKSLAIPIGLGFSAVDITYLMVVDFLAKAAFSGLLLTLVSLNIVFSLLFHPGTAAFIKSGLLSGSGKISLAICIALHSIVDGGLVAVDFLVLFNPANKLTLITIYWAVTMIIGVGIFAIGLRRLSRVSEVATPVEPLVF